LGDFRPPKGGLWGVCTESWYPPMIAKLSAEGVGKIPGGCDEGVNEKEKKNYCGDRGVAVFTQKKKKKKNTCPP